MKRIIICLFFIISVTSAQWSTDPAAPQSLGSGVYAQVAATSDGGVYVAWLSDGNYHVYLQRMNALGEPQLGDNGMVVSDNTNASWIAVYHLNLAVDSEDNAIITTVDQRTGVWEVYAWKIAPDGSMLWGDDGVALTTASTSNMSPRLTVLPDNSVVVTCTHNDNTVFFQRISAAGALLWGTGILIADNNANLLSPQPIVSGNGDVLIQWVRQTGPVWAADSELYLQKYDYDGNPQWSNPIVAAGPVVFPMGNWSQQSVADADSGSFSAWTEMSGNAQSAVVQHISGDGALSWTGSVDLSANSSNFRMSPQLTVADDTQELMAVWREANGSQSQRGVYAQRLDSSGNRLWGANGTAVVGLNSNYDYLDLSVAGFGDDLIAAYIEQSVTMNGDIYAARLDADGNYVWTGGAATVTNSGSPKSDMMTGKGLGCLFIAWTENGSVYTHCLLEDGTLGAPDAGSPDCTADDGTDGVELWGECYSIENTEFLYLAQSGLSGPIPPEIGDLINLRELSLWGNNLSGEIPSSIGNLNNLEYLWLGEYNNLTGNIPPEIGDLTNLRALDIWGNNLNGTIPPEIGNLTNLEILWLHGNSISGEIPSEIGYLVDLEYLHLGWNSLTGHIPEDIGNLINLRELILISNSFTGEIPSGIANMEYLTALVLGGNSFSGGIPLEIFNLQSLEELSLWGNNFSGEIPVEIGNLLNLERLWIDGNSFSGPIPESIGDLQNIYSINISYNQFSGEIPESICNLGLDWGQWDDYVTNGISNNNLCPPYPECISPTDIGYQDTSNCEQVSIIDGTLPITYNLYNAYPNPFNPATTLQYDLPEDGFVNITIYDMLGRQVKSLINQTQDAGFKSVLWNATNDYGKPVSAGVYLYQIQAGEFVQTKIHEQS